MKKIIILLLCTHSCFNPLFAQRVVRKGMKDPGNTYIRNQGPKYNISRLAGKWQEAERRNLRNNRVSFTDSMLLFINNDRGRIGESAGMNLTMLGGAAIDPPATLNIAGSSFTILKVTDNSLILRDDDRIHILKKVPFFQSETVGKD